MRRAPGPWIVPALLASTLTGAPTRADEPFDPAALEFFETQVRPILARRCQTCHGPEKPKGGLRLDSREAILTGGLTGPAVVPGEPEESLLVDAIRYGDLVQMPPKSKLPPGEIDVLTRWVAQGAPWPPAHEGGAVAGTAESFDLRERAEHWSFRPIRVVEPPGVRDTDWPINPIDRFLLARLESAGLRPAPEADRRTLLRRVTFDLTGLPPTPGEVEDFLADESPAAYERVVDRLLASPHYGERLARRWLDLVRYAETSGHEFDYDIPNAWRYRDYLVRAFNDDLPYDRLVIEHVAGDLLERPRRHPVAGSDESILATGFYLLGEGTHSPVDVREEQLRRVDNQIDVLCKTFLGLTVACARCHDHKFDPITQADYYALAGFFKSTRHQHAFIDPPEFNRDAIAELASLVRELRASWIDEAAPTGLAGRIAAYAEASARLATRGGDAAGVEGVARASGLEASLLTRWVAALSEPEVRLPGHPLAGLVSGDPIPVAGATDAGAVVFEDFERPDWGGWTATGDAFGAGPSGPGAGRVGGAGWQPVPPGEAHSGLVSDRLQGVLRSPSFTIGRRFILYRASGRGGRISLIVDGFEKVRAPIYGGLVLAVDEERPRWYAQDVSMWVGHRAYIEVADGAVVDFTGSQSRYAAGDGHVALDEIRFADSASVPPDPSPTAAATARGGGLAERARRFGAEVADAVRYCRSPRWGLAREDARRIEDLAWLAGRGLLTSREDQAAEGLRRRYREVESTIREPTLAPAVADGPGEDESLLIRGNARSPGEPVPRRFLEVFAGGGTFELGTGSGRLELARRLVDHESNPLPARVLVNRLWLLHFGRGLVPSPDDLGHMGQSPSHPELLDFLARRFVEDGWSIKRLRRLIILSRAYRMSSRLDPVAEAADPENRLYHRADVRRLEAEPIRDAMLAVSGRLVPTLFGPSVPPHLTPFMEGRGRPSRSGPLDGDGRRSLYLNVRRNFLPPLLLAFDYPPPATTMGRRNVSNVPAQALTLLNDPFVLDQARRWAERVLSEPADGPEDRVDRMYLAAFGRPPSGDERAGALAFLGDAARTGDVGPWADLAHVLLNGKEFVFLP